MNGFGFNRVNQRRKKIKLIYLYLTYATVVVFVVVVVKVQIQTLLSKPRRIPPVLKNLFKLLEFFSEF